MVAAQEGERIRRGLGHERRWPTMIFLEDGNWFTPGLNGESCSGEEWRRRGGRGKRGEGVRLPVETRTRRTRRSVGENRSPRAGGYGTRRASWAGPGKREVAILDRLAGPSPTHNANFYLNHFFKLLRI
jgi:hypothetical protein